MNEVVINRRRTGLLDDVRFVPEPTVIESVIKHWRAELLEVALRNCPCMRMCV